ncbi:MAG TPA: SpvB/TcaC N-terminal domain-containing protein, partial [Aestuariivirgaceae bacterium]|nr:SpvB/TcaC N-terminal domain-containing protein [Aestuariivirgaceae bacterium]
MKFWVRLCGLIAIVIYSSGVVAEETSTSVTAPVAEAPAATVQTSKPQVLDLAAEAEKSGSKPSGGTSTSSSSVSAVATTAASTSKGGNGSGGSSGPQQPVAPYNGAFDTTIPIKVPAFRGLEPRLGFHYNSSFGITNFSRPGGELGIGWRISGLSVIEAASTGRGVPKFDGSDIYLRDGEEIISCTSSMTSPSCTSGGTHVMRVETYERIKRDTAANSWEVTQRDGTKLLYKRLGDGQTYDATNATTNTLATSYKWFLRSVTDTHGNVVNYSYWCNGIPNCYINSITYNGTTITFYREVRSDVVSYATGLGLGSVGLRIKTVDVSLTEGRVAAYKLTYETSATSGSSRLTAVQEYGKDAVLDASGSIVSGTSLPAHTITYSSAASSFSTGITFSATTPHYVGDFDGDTISDYANADTAGTSITGMYRKWSFIRYTSVTSFSSTLPSSAIKLFVADFTADHRSDFLKFSGTSSAPRVEVYASTGSKFEVK